MTLTEIVAECAERLNLSSTEAYSRMTREANQVYRKVLSSVGLDKPVRSVVTSTTVLDTQYVTFANTQRLYSVFNADGLTLTELLFDELRNRQGFAGPPRCFAVSNIYTRSVRIYVDTLSSTDTYALSADALVYPGDMNDEEEPVFNELFHDIIGSGVRRIELFKMEKQALANEEEAYYEGRLSELRLFLAKSAYLDIVQGKTTRTNTTRFLGT